MKILPLLAGFCFLTPAFAQTASYPGAIATSQNLKVGVNGVSTLLTADVTSSATTLTISSCAGIVAYTLVTLDQEIMDVVGCSGTTLLVDIRGFDNTNAVAHVAGTVIYANVDAWHHNALAAEIQAIEIALGINLSNVGGGGGFSGAPALVVATPASSSGTAALLSITHAYLPEGDPPSNGTYCLQAVNGVVAWVTCGTSGTLSWSGLTNAQWIAMTNSQWTGMTN